MERTSCALFVQVFRPVAPTLFNCDAMFQAIQLRFPNLPWMLEHPNVRILHLFAVGAAKEVVLPSALLVDANMGRYYRLQAER